MLMMFIRVTWTCGAVLLVTCLSFYPAVCLERPLGIFTDEILTTYRQRSSRQAVTQYYLDVFVIVDYDAFQSWYDRTNSSLPVNTRKAQASDTIEKYFTLVLKEVSDQYGRLQIAEFRLNVKPAGFYIAQDQQSSPWTQTSNGLVDADSALQSLQTWLRVMTISLPQIYDHTMLFTGKDIASDNEGHTLGRATSGTICRGSRYDSVSIIEDKGAFDSVATAVHELGHSLNASHDGVNNDCFPEDRYIMTAVNTAIFNDTTKRHPWFFSSCSASEISHYVQNLLSNSSSVSCLGEPSSPSSGVPNVTGIIPGQLYNQDEQCRHIYGQQSSYCFTGNLSDICVKMGCLDTNSVILKRCVLWTAATGTSCGNKQWCQVGECVGSAEAPSMSSCFRDMSTLLVGKPCSVAVRDQPALCYDAEVSTQCCQSCQAIHSGNAACPYGDRKSGCNAAVCKMILADGRVADEDCCDTCNFDASTWQCRDAGISCSQAVIKDRVNQCYNFSLAFQCCDSCRSRRDLSRAEGCEYGDRLVNGCPIYDNGQCNTQFCCETCGKIAESGSHRTATVPWLSSVWLILTVVVMIYDW